MIVDVKEIVENKKEKLKARVQELNKNNIFPKLAIIKASDDKASDVYIGKKRQLCAEIGVLEEEYIFDNEATQEEIIDVIHKLNKDKNVHGILVQLPLFRHLKEKEILDEILPEKDADGLSKVNFGKLVTGQKGIVSCTPKGIITIIDSLGEDISGKNATVIGRSILVGKPMSLLLLERGATVTTCHSKTSDLKYYTSNADILIVAVGKPGLITVDMVKENSIIIDVGITRTENGIKGDVELNKEMEEKVKYITPVPGGVGLTTVLSLIENVIEIAESN